MASAFEMAAAWPLRWSKGARIARGRYEKSAERRGTKPRGETQLTSLGGGNYDE